ncbi:MAG: hypothetical protein ACRDS9_14670 [Pseudonocardiaceae bacterium]
MDHTPQDRQIPGQPSPAADPDQGDRPPSCRAGESGIASLRWTRCPNEGCLHLLAPAEVVVVTDPPLISGDAAARALQEYFLANADCGDNTANDELVAEILRRIRALRACRADGC